MEDKNLCCMTCGMELFVAYLYKKTDILECKSCHEYYYYDLKRKSLKPDSIEHNKTLNWLRLSFKFRYIPEEYVKASEYYQRKMNKKKIHDHPTNRPITIYLNEDNYKKENGLCEVYYSFQFNIHTIPIRIIQLLEKHEFKFNAIPLKELSITITPTIKSKTHEVIYEDQLNQTIHIQYGLSLEDVKNLSMFEIEKMCESIVLEVLKDFYKDEEHINVIEVVQNLLREEPVMEEKQLFLNKETDTYKLTIQCQVRTYDLFPTVFFCVLNKKTNKVFERNYINLISLFELKLIKDVEYDECLKLISKSDHNQVIKIYLK